MSWLLSTFWVALGRRRMDWQRSRSPENTAWCRQLLYRSSRFVSDSFFDSPPPRREPPFRDSRDPDDRFANVSPNVLHTPVDFFFDNSFKLGSPFLKNKKINQEKRKEKNSGEKAYQ